MVAHFRRVKLTDENRFGLLGKASVLAVTSYTTRTSPTIRGKWLLENILAAPPPAPPPNVPSLESSNKDGKPLSVRQMLEMHRANPACASCHARMDPLGLSLENFDAIGQWRTTDAGHPIDASGVLLDGTKVDGPRELRQALMAQKTAICGSGNGETPDVRFGPRTAVLRCSHGPRDRSLRGGRWIPLVVADTDYCEERAIPDENRRTSGPGDSNHSQKVRRTGLCS